MTTKQFNEKYKDFLEEGHYGLAINDPTFIEWLDKQFQEFIKLPGFSYSQIKAKFGMGRFYCKGLSDEQIRTVEKSITQICTYDDILKKKLSKVNRFEVIDDTGTVFVKKGFKDLKLEFQDDEKTLKVFIT